MKRLLVTVFLIFTFLLQGYSQWQPAAAALARQLAVKALETCVTLLVTEGAKNCFDKSGKPDLPALDARFRTVEAIIGSHSGPLKSVRANLDTDTTAASYVKQVSSAILRIDESLQRDQAEIAKLEGRVAKLESGLEDLGVRMTNVETDVQRLKIDYERLLKIVQGQALPKTIGWIYLGSFDEQKGTWYDPQIAFGKLTPSGLKAGVYTLIRDSEILKSPNEETPQRAGILEFDEKGLVPRATAIKSGASARIGAFHFERFSKRPRVNAYGQIINVDRTDLQRIP